VKILYWTGLFPPNIGGLETFSLELLHGLQRRGHEVMVVSLRLSAELPEFSTYQGIPVHRFDFMHVLSSRELPRISGLLERVRTLKRTFAPDLIHVNDSGVGLFFQLNTPYPCPTVCTLHGPFPSDAQEHPLRVRLLQEASRIVTVSQAVYDAMRDFEEIMSHTSVLLNGLSLPTLAPAPLPTDSTHFLCTGRLVAEKGFDLALEAFAALLPDFPALRLSIAGDGKCRPELEALAQRLGIEQSVRFMGWVARDEIPALINTATAVVIPSRWEEPFGLVALESAQMARPAIVTRVGGLPEIVLDGETGWVIQPANSAALAQAMRAVLDNPDESARRGAAARQRAAREFSGERMVGEYERMFETVREAKS
jgi:glycogen(starch) synthase